LIEKCLIHIYDIPEPDLVRLLKFFLTDAKEDSLKKYVEGKQKLNPKERVLLPGDGPSDFFLYLITSAPRNDIFLQTSVKSLTFTEVMVSCPCFLSFFFPSFCLVFLFLRLFLLSRMITSNISPPTGPPAILEEDGAKALGESVRDVEGAGCDEDSHVCAGA